MLVSFLFPPSESGLQEREVPGVRQKTQEQFWLLTAGAGR